MSENKSERIHLLCCANARIFAQNIIEELSKFCTKDDFHVIKSSEYYFANGEIKTVIEDSIRGKSIYIVQCIESSSQLVEERKKSINDNLMALFTAIDAVRRAGAEKTHVILMPFPYSRQEKQKFREPITASIIAQFLESLGITTLVTVDIHAEAIAGFFRSTNLLNIQSANTLIKHLQTKHVEYLTNLVVVSPDVGGASRARYFASKLGSDLALVSKERDYSQLNKVERVTLIGNVKNKNALVVDDMIDTGGTIVNVVKILKQNGVKNIFVCCAFPLFSPPCIQRFDALYNEQLLDKVIATDAINHGQDFADNHPWYEQVSIAPLFAQILSTLSKNGSISELLEK